MTPKPKKEKYYKMTLCSCLHSSRGHRAGKQLATNNDLPYKERCLVLVDKRVSTHSYSHDMNQQTPEEVLTFVKGQQRVHVFLPLLLMNVSMIRTVPGRKLCHV